jgi:hypothetical protein
MHPLSKHVKGPHFEAVFGIQELLCIKDHLGSQTPRGVNTSDLDILSINILLDNLVDLLIRQEVAKSIHRVPKQGKAIY